jgi:hypothetical protein
MVRFGPRLEKRQAVLFRLVDIGAELFAIAAACARAQVLRGQGPAADGDARVTDVADLFCRHARRRVESRFASVFRNDDSATYAVAQRVLEHQLLWLEEGMVRDVLWDQTVQNESAVRKESPVHT